MYYTVYTKTFILYYDNHCVYRLLPSRLAYSQEVLGSVARTYYIIIEEVTQHNFRDLRVLELKNSQKYCQQKLPQYFCCRRLTLIQDVAKSWTII